MHCRLNKFANNVSVADDSRVSYHLDLADSTGVLAVQRWCTSMKTSDVPNRSFRWNTLSRYTEYPGLCTFVSFFSQYFTRWPSFSMHSCRRLGMDANSFFMIFLSSFWKILLTVDTYSSKSWHPTAFTSLSTMAHTFSIGLKSGLWGGHFFTREMDVSWTLLKSSNT